MFCFLGVLAEQNNFEYSGFLLKHGENFSVKGRGTDNPKAVITRFTFNEEVRRINIIKTTDRKEFLQLFKMISVLLVPDILVQPEQMNRLVTQAAGLNLLKLAFFIKTYSSHLNLNIFISKLKLYLRPYDHKTILCSN